MKKLKLNILFIFLSILTFVSPYTIAQTEYSTFSPDILANSFGGSLVTYTHNPAIVFWNPGGLAFTVEDRVLVNFNNSSDLNFFAFSKFIPPKNSIGFSYSKLFLPSSIMEVSTGAVSRRLNDFLSAGAALNFGRYRHNDVKFISSTLGLMVKPSINRFSYNNDTFSLKNLLINPVLYDKFAFGLVFHNIPMDNNRYKHQVRIGGSFKLMEWGPMVNLAYNIQEHKDASHIGIGTNVTSNFFFYAGSTNFDINHLSFGGSINYDLFSVNVGYYARTEKISFSFSVLLNRSSNYLSKQYADSGTRKIKETDFRGAYSDYIKSLSYQKDNKTLIYLSHVLKDRIAQEDAKIDSLIAKATKFEERRWYVNATLTYQQVLKINPYNSKAINSIRSLKPKCSEHINKLFVTGTQLFKTDDLEKAKFAFNEILQIDATHTGAIKYLAKIDSVNSYLSKEYYYRGVGYYKQRNLNKAISAFRRVSELNPNDTEAVNQLQKITNEIETNKQRIAKLYDEAHNLRKNNNHYQASQKYREIIDFNKDEDQAVKQNEVLQSMMNNMIESKFQHAVSLYNRGDYPGAQNLFREVLETLPNHRQSRNYLTLIRDKSSESVEQRYQEALQYYNEKRWDDALAITREIIERYPDHAEALQLNNMLMSQIYISNQEKIGLENFNQGNYQEAYKIFNQILDLNPDNIIARTYKTECESKLNKKISELFRKGMEFYTNGKYELAIQEWDRVLAIDPNYASALDYKRRAEEMLKAIKELK